MSASEKIIKVFHMAGQDEKRQKLLPIVLDSLMLAIAIGSVAYTVNNWTKNEQTDKLKLANETNITLTIVVYSTKYSLKSRNMKKLLDIIDSELPNPKTALPAAQRDLIVKTGISKINTLKNMAILVYSMLITLMLLPGIISSYNIYKYKFKNENITTLPLPVNVWYPKQHIVETYAVVYLLECVYYLSAAPWVFCTFGAVACSFQSIVLNIKVFCMKLTEFDAMLLKCEDQHSYNLTLHEYSKYVVQCHQHILRYVKKQTNAVSLALTACNQCICFQMCVFVFLITSVDNTIERISYTISVASLIIFIFIYCVCGQNVINGSEDIRNAMYESSWLDKPEWFKRDLRIMMTMANTTLQIKPFGLYVLELNTFTSVMNAAYTYFNMLRTLKN